MGYTYILRHGHCYRNTFFYPHGACFTLVYPGCFSFYVYVCAVCYCVCLVLPCGVACFAWSCVSGVLPLLASCDRVSGSCDLVWPWSGHGRVVWSGLVWSRWVRVTALAYLLYVFNTISFR